MRAFAVIVSLLCLPCTSAVSQSTSFTTIDEIITTLYSVISGPSGEERDWQLFDTLFTENAIMGAVAQNANGRMFYRSMTPASYAENNGVWLEENGFWESEIGREVHRFGELAHVFTAYQFVIGDNPNGEIARRGINSVQLIYKDDRWWITSIQWNAERDDLPLPKEMTGKN